VTEGAREGARAEARDGLLLVAYGNRLRGDDGVAWHVADRVLAALAGEAAARLRTITAHQLTPELADAVADAGIVVFVDAACDRPPGAVVVRPVAPAPGPTAGLTHHHYDPPMVLRLAREVHGRAPAEAWLVTVGAGSFDCGETLSPTVAAAVPAACDAALGVMGLRLRNE
jgi:hydrogenase maturation protease